MTPIEPYDDDTYALMLAELLQRLTQAGWRRQARKTSPVAEDWWLAPDGAWGLVFDHVGAFLCRVEGRHWPAEAGACRIHVYYSIWPVLNLGDGRRFDLVQRKFA